MNETLYYKVVNAVIVDGVTYNPGEVIALTEGQFLALPVGDVYQVEPTPETADAIANATEEEPTTGTVAGEETPSADNADAPVELEDPEADQSTAQAETAPAPEAPVATEEKPWVGNHKV